MKAEQKIKLLEIELKYKKEEIKALEKYIEGLEDIIEKAIKGVSKEDDKNTKG